MSLADKPWASRVRIAKLRAALLEIAEKWQGYESNGDDMKQLAKDALHDDDVRAELAAQVIDD